MSIKRPTKREKMLDDLTDVLFDAMWEIEHNVDALIEVADNLRIDLKDTFKALKGCDGYTDGVRKRLQNLKMNRHHAHNGLRYVKNILVSFHPPKETES